MGGICPPARGKVRHGSRATPPSPVTWIVRDRRSLALFWDEKRGFDKFGLDGLGWVSLCSEEKTPKSGQSSFPQ